MKKTVVIAMLISLLMASCETFSGIGQVVSGLSESLPKTTAAATLQGEVDFRQDEVLCSVSKDEAREDARYMPAIILTAPTAATANQAEVMYAGGNKSWTHIVLPSRKANNEDMEVGKSVLYMYYQSDDEDMSQDKYRNNNWQFGNITSTDELFKGIVEIDGRPMYVKWVRIEQ